MKKSFMKIFVCIMLLVSLIPANALAEASQVGDLAVTGGSIGKDYTYENNILTILSGTELTISGTTTKDNIVIKSGVTANIILNGVNIQLDDGDDGKGWDDKMPIMGTAAFDIEKDACANVCLMGDNILKSGVGQAAIHVPEKAELIIDGKGTLNAKGGLFSPGIGGSNILDENKLKMESILGENAGNITINAGNINAVGGEYGAGIGGSSSLASKQKGGNGGNITINGGNVNAQNGYAGMHETWGEIFGAAAIGGGTRGDGGNITITGGNVQATGDKKSFSAGAAIGGGAEGGAGNILIEGGTVKAIGAYESSGIGSGTFYWGEGISSDGYIKITGGEVLAEGGKGAAGIGTSGSWDAANSNSRIEITGGTVHAKGGDAYMHDTRGEGFAGAGIGLGSNGIKSEVIISGGTVYATGGRYPLEIWSPEMERYSASGIGYAYETKYFNSRSFSFSTGNNSNAVIYAMSGESTSKTGEHIADQSNKNNWSGIIYEGNAGKVYGDVTIDEDVTLTIEKDSEVSILKDARLINKGNVVVKGTLKSYGLNNFVESIDAMPKGTFTFYEGGEWYNKNGKSLYVGGTGAGLELKKDTGAAMEASFSENALEMKVCSGTIIQNVDKTLSSVMLPDVANRLVIEKDAVYQIVSGKTLTVPALGELVNYGELKIDGSVILEPGSKYTLKNGVTILIPKDGKVVELNSTGATEFPKASIIVQEQEINANGAVLEADGSITLKNGDRITPSGELEHKYSTDWKYDENSHWNECACGEKANVDSHDFKWIVDKEATLTSVGYKHEECTVCGYKKDAIEIPMLTNGEDSSDVEEPNSADDKATPNTGAHSNVFGLFAVFMLSGVGLLLMARKRNISK